MRLVLAYARLERGVLFVRAPHQSVRQWFLICVNNLRVSGGNSRSRTVTSEQSGDDVPVAIPYAVRPSLCFLTSARSIRSRSSTVIATGSVDRILRIDCGDIRSAACVSPPLSAPRHDEK